MPTRTTSETAQNTSRFSGLVDSLWVLWILSRGYSASVQCYPGTLIRYLVTSERSFAMAIGIASKRMHIMQLALHIMHMHCITQRDPAAPKCTDSVLLCGCACLWFCNRSPEITGTCNELQRVATSSNELQRAQQSMEENNTQ